LISAIENREFTTAFTGNEKRKTILTRSIKKTSEILHEFFSEFLGALDQPNIYAIWVFWQIGFYRLGYLPIHKIENWIEANGEQVRSNVTTIGFFRML